jgi:VCBS repeat-containing protein
VPPPVNAAPAFTTQSLTTSEETDGSAQLTATDPENQALTFAIATQPQNGTATLTAAGALTYSPAPNYFGADTLTVTVTDSAGAQTTGTVNVTVTNVNDAPVVADDVLRVAVTPGQPIVLTPVANDVDDDGDTLTPTIVAQPAHGGTIAVNATTRAITFQPANGYVGPIEFSYRVNDGTVDSAVATARAVIGAFDSVAFLSDYSTPGLNEVHAYDGIEVRRLNDALPAGASVTSFALSGDMSTLAYVVSAADADRVYVKSLTGNGPAVVRYTSAKVIGATFGVSGALNANGSHMWVYDGYHGFANQDRKEYFVFDTATGVARQLAGDMNDVVDIRILQWHPYEANLLMVQGQTAGSVPLNVSNAAMSAFLGNATDVRTLDQIGLTYAPGEYGSGEGFYYGPDTRYIYHTEYKHSGGSTITNLLRYDRVLEQTTAIVRTPVPPDRGMNGVVSSSPDRSRMCFGYYEPSTTTNDGPSKFYAMDQATGATTAVTGVLSDIAGCAIAADNRTLFYRTWSTNHVDQQIFVVDSVSPGAPVPLLPINEPGNSEAGALMPASGAARVAVVYYDGDGLAGTTGQLGRMYTMPADGTGDAFLFSDTFQHSFVISPFNASDGAGSFIVHTRQQGSIYKLELMSTHALNLSIPLSSAGETLGVRSVRWMRPYP